MGKHYLNRTSGSRLLYLLLVIPALLIAMMVNFVATLLVERYDLEIDLTANSAFGLEETTTAYLDSLDTPVAIQVLTTQSRFEANSTYNAQASNTMAQMAQASDQVTLTYINYTQDPTFAANYPQYEFKEGDVLVTSGDRSRHILTEDLFNYTQAEDGTYSIASSKAEQTLLTGLMYVVSPDLPQVAVLTGHGESVPDAFVTLLTDNNFELYTVQLATQDIPADTDIVLLCAPSVDYSAEELSRLDGFLAQDGAYGKTLFYTAHTASPALSSLEAYLAEWGVIVGDGAVFETDETLVYQYNPFYAVASDVSTTYPDLLKNADVPFLAALSKPLSLAFATRDSNYTETLLEFSASSGVRPSDASDDFTSNDATWTGPIPALVLCSYKERDSQNATIITAQSNVLVAGSTVMLDAMAVSNTAFSNGTYLINLLSQFCQREETSVVAPKTIEGQPLNMTQATADRLGMVFIGVIPGAILLMGIAVWLNRRHK